MPRTSPHFLQDCGIVRRGGDHGNARKILGGGPNHRRTADVNILDQVGKARLGTRSHLLEGIQVDDHQINESDGELLQSPEVCGIVAPGQNSRMNGGMKGLHAAVQHFRQAGHLRYVLHRDSRFAQQAARAAGRKNFHTLFG